MQVTVKVIEDLSKTNPKRLRPDQNSWRKIRQKKRRERQFFDTSCDPDAVST